MSFPFRAGLMMGLLALSACATQVPLEDGATSSLRVGMTRDEVESALGVPADRITNGDGFTIWRYVRAGEATSSTSFAQEVTITFAGDRVVSVSHSSSTTTTTVTTTP